MKKQPFIFLGVILILIVGCIHTNSSTKDVADTNLLLTTQLTPTNSRQPISSSKTKLSEEKPLRDELEATKNEVNELRKNSEDKFSILPSLTTSIENKYENKMSNLRKDAKTFFGIAEQYISHLKDKADSYLNIIVIIGVLAAIIGTIFTIIGSIGLFHLRKLQKEFTETVELHRFLQQRAIEKQQELHLQHGYLILHPHERKKFTDLEKERFLDFDHMIYFIYHNLPLTKDVDFYKMSLYILGAFFLWDHRPERAIIRFEEIERLENIRITAPKSADKFKYHIHTFYNQYGNACLDYTRKCKREKLEGYEEYIKRAVRCYNKSISLKNDFSKPYYNLGLIYGYEREENEKGISYYKQVIGREPRILEDGTDIYLRTYRNWGCCWVRHNKLKEPDEELISILDNIPEKHSYWNVIINDEVLRPVLDTEKGKAFLLKKGFSI